MKIPFIKYHTLKILNEFVDEFIPLDLFLSNYFRKNKSIGSKDRKKICEMIYGITRWKGLIDYLIDKPATFEKRVNFWDSFDPSCYQQSNIPAHIRVSFPKTYYDQIVKSHKEDADKICFDSNFPAPTTIRVNTLKIQRKILFNRWKNTYNISLCNYSKQGIVFHEKINFFALDEFKKGLFEIQDEGSQLIASLLDISSTDLVLDYCAGGGGKTLAFAPKMENKGQIFLYDIRQTALIQAKKRLKRAGIQNAQIVLDISNLKKHKKKFDYILTDVPCSGSGTLRRNPDMKWKFSMDSLKNLIKEQREIFDKALTYLKPSGKIIYSTCSILNEENIDQINFFINKHSLKLEQKPFISIPKKNQMDGFFAATLSFNK